MATIKTKNGLNIDEAQQAGQRFQVFSDPVTNEELGSRPVNGTLKSKAVNRRSERRVKGTPHQNPRTLY